MISSTLPVARPTSTIARDNISISLNCPVLFTPLKDAVLLAPCGHTISEVAAKQLYKGIEPNSSRCPICRAIVQDNYPNMIMRSLVEQILGVKAEEVLPALSAQVEADSIPDEGAVSYPGKGAKLVLTEGTWDIFDSGAELVRYLEFKSQNRDSLLKKLSVLGYRDGRVALMIYARKQYLQEAKNYFSNFGMKIESYSYKSDASDLKLLFKILAKHNEIPSDKFALIRDLAQSGDWRNVTPLKEGERLPVVSSFSQLTFCAW